MRTILLIRFSSLGDLVTMEPMYRALRHFHRDDRIIFLTSPVGQELYGDTGYFDRIVTDACPPKSGLLAHALCLRNRVGMQTFDLIYNLQGSSLAHVLVLLLRKRRVVNKSSSLWHKLLSVKISGKTVPELIRAGGFDARAVADYFQRKENKLMRLEVDPALVGEYRQLLKRACGDRPVVVLAPGASPRWESKKWGDERFAALAVRLLNAGFAVVVIGSAAEQDAARHILTRVPDALDFTGRTRVGQLKALLMNAAVMVGNDSGPAHIAAAVGTPTVTIFGPTSSIHCVKNFSYRGEHVCLTPPDGRCHTCYNPRCSKSRECMAGISIDRVFDAVQDLAATR